MAPVKGPTARPIKQPGIGVSQGGVTPDLPKPKAHTAPSTSDALTRLSIAPGPDSTTTNDVTRRIGQFTGYADSIIPGGPLQGFLGSTAVGVGGGWLASKLWNALGDEDEEEKKDRSKRWSIIGGLATGVPAAVGSSLYAIPSVKQHGISGLFKYPTKTASVLGTALSQQVKRAYEWPPQNDMPLFQTIGAISSANDLSPVSKAFAINTVQNAANSGQGLTFGSLLGGAVGAGLGLMVGSGVARVLGAFVDLPDAGKKIITTTGVLGGALKGVGLI